MSVGLAHVKVLCHELSGADLWESPQECREERMVILVAESDGESPRIMFSEEKLINDNSCKYGNTKLLPDGGGRHH